MTQAQRTEEQADIVMAFADFVEDTHQRMGEMSVAEWRGAFLGATGQAVDKDTAETVVEAIVVPARASEPAHQRNPFNEFIDSAAADVGANVALNRAKSNAELAEMLKLGAKGVEGNPVSPAQFNALVEAAGDDVTEHDLSDEEVIALGRRRLGTQVVAGLGLTGAALAAALVGILRLRRRQAEEAKIVEDASSVEDDAQINSEPSTRSEVGSYLPAIGNFKTVMTDDEAIEEVISTGRRILGKGVVASIGLTGAALAAAIIGLLHFRQDEDAERQDSDPEHERQEVAGSPPLSSGAMAQERLKQVVKVAQTSVNQVDALKAAEAEAQKIAAKVTDPMSEAHAYLKSLSPAEIQHLADTISADLNEPAEQVSHILTGMTQATVGLGVAAGAVTGYLAANILNWLQNKLFRRQAETAPDKAERAEETMDARVSYALTLLSPEQIQALRDANINPDEKTDNQIQELGTQILGSSTMQTMLVSALGVGGTLFILRKLLSPSNLLAAAAATIAAGLAGKAVKSLMREGEEALPEEEVTAEQPDTALTELKALFARAGVEASGDTPEAIYRSALGDYAREDDTLEQLAVRTEYFLKERAAKPAPAAVRSGVAASHNPVRDLIHGN